MTRLWDKGENLDDAILRYTAGEDHVLDARLVPYDVAGSIAHATMLNQQGLLSDKDLNTIREELERLGQQHTAGEWTIDLEDEDVHTALETRLTASIGTAGERLHLGRSRNDQVLTAIRLYIKDAAQALAEAAQAVADSLEEIATAQGDIPLPGYTHMQQGMPSRVALWARGFAAELEDDARGLRDSARRADRNPLGSAAGYGVPGLPLDRSATTSLLQFRETQDPVTAVQLSRGKAESELIFEIYLALADVSRLAADLLLFYTQEFAYVTLPDSMTTGSSIMPQKRNPDVLELLRAAPAVVQGALVETLAITAKLSSGYHRDLQRLKPPLFRSIDIGLASLQITAHTLNGISFRKENIVLDDGLYAAERANELVLTEGIPFREAYRRVAKTIKSSS